MTSLTGRWRESPFARDGAEAVRRFRMMASQVVRWRLRGLLKLLPTRGKSGTATADAREASAENSAYRVAYLFAGTYGDFVQVLKPLRRLAAAYPCADLLLFGADRYAREFASELPPTLRIAPPFDPFRWVFRPVDLLITNCVGVYRVRFDFAARFCARRAYGFRHAHESRRGGYADTVPLLPEVRSFADENLRALDLAGVPDEARIEAVQAPDEGTPSPAAEDWAPGSARIGSGALGFAAEDPHTDLAADVAGEAADLLGMRMPVSSGGLVQGGKLPAWGKGKILFHIGSAGLKRDFGFRAYTRLVFAVLKHLEGRPVEVVMGPGDEDIALEVRTGTGFVPQMYPLSRLVRLLASFEGTVLCFNSFSAHICHYLGRPAVVMHRQAVPYGYDCAPLHKQVVLKEESGWDLGGVWAALEPEQPADPPQA